jgi:phenylalanine-4-hydroxylase
MFIDPEFAHLSQEFGLFSLGATDEQISLLGALYWFTVEFGSVKEQGQIKAYGGGIAGSIAECQV